MTLTPRHASRSVADLDYWCLDRHELWPSLFGGQHRCGVLDMVATIDRGDIGALVFMDVSAAFDPVDHGIILDVLQQRFDIHDAALDWFASYVVDRTQVVFGTDSSFVSELQIGAPQEFRAGT